MISSVEGVDLFKNELSNLMSLTFFCLDTKESKQRKNQGWRLFLTASEQVCG
jgi:hypothetical protein